MSATTSADKPAKPSVWKAFTQPAAWTMFFFGFSSGLPFLLVAGTLAYWLKDNGIELESITVIAGAGMTYALKFLWAPLLDHTRLPGLARRIYLTDLDLFERVYAASQSDIRVTIAKLLELARVAPKKPYASVRKYLGDPVADSTRTLVR